MVNDFLGGAIVMGFLMASLMFLKFWRRTRDGLFLSFAASFVLLAITQALLSIGAIPTEERSWVYLLRLSAFLLILFALWRKNARSRSAL